MVIGDASFLFEKWSRSCCCVGGFFFLRGVVLVVSGAFHPGCGGVLPGVARIWRLRRYELEERIGRMWVRSGAIGGRL